MDILGIFGVVVGIGAVLGGIAFGASMRVVEQFERGVVFRFGRVRAVRDPGLRMLIPGVDRMRKVPVQIVTMPVPGQEGITRDNVTVRVDVQDYLFAIAQVAQTSLRSIIGKSDLDDLLSNREHLNRGLELMIDSPALSWGVHIDRVEIKDVALPESMKRSMSRQAEAERERRARVITAEGELQASQKLADAGETMAAAPAALQLRLLQTVVEVAAEKNSTLVLPFPVELLRFLERSTPAEKAAESDEPTEPDESPRASAEPADPALEPKSRTRSDTIEILQSGLTREEATIRPRPDE
jgi:regulator of protease activity HflC (stomatin/prohibitin superfamily)